MKKFALLAFTLFILGWIPGAGHAATTECNGYTIEGLDQTPITATCTFTARGAETYWIASSNPWKFVVKRGTTTVQTVTGGPGTAPTGALNSHAGDKVTYTGTSTCAQGQCFLSTFLEIGATPADWFDLP